ncbi:MAG: single-stranded DNA-binding protein [Elusimicrobia bacterium]|nr:single-stranded DNA-binding protein [Elusimicrobiota bacterium]MDE2314262.1 single-stranded DNA-binding protein [Elusimicrobiota bacterium]
MERNETQSEAQDGRREGDRNEAAVIGRLAGSASVRNFGEDKTRAQFIVAVERPGRGRPFYDYVLVTAWHGLAHQAAGLSKGASVEVEGRLRTWQGENGRNWGIEAQVFKVIDRGPNAAPAQTDRKTAAAGA